MANPIKPKNDKDPAGTGRIKAAAEKSIKQALKRVGQRAVETLKSVPVRSVDDNAGGLQINKSYLYLIAGFQLEQISEQISTVIKEELQPALLDEFIAASFNLGTTAAIANLANQTTLPYTAATKIQSAAHLARVAIVQNRAFEFMLNLTSDTRAALNRVLTSGITNGINPTDIAKQIYQQIGIPEWSDSPDGAASYARAMRIARTEINHAHREAGRAQDRDANEVGVKTGLLWFSALRRTTRTTHAENHGKIFTRDEVASFYSRDANEISCNCVQRSIVLNDDGLPMSPDFVEKIRASGVRFFSE
jgi:hypothetical protein